MKQNDKSKFLDLFTGLCEVFDKKYSEVLLKVYFTSLEKFTIEQVEIAINLVIQKDTFFPKPANIIEYAGGGSSEDLAELEASKVLKAISSVGKYENICFDDPVTQAVIESRGGWPRVCDLEEDEVKWFSKEFMSTYRAFLNQNVKKYGVLLGLNRVYNNAHGREDDSKLFLIGNKEKAKEISLKKEESGLLEISHTIGNI